MAKVPSPQCDVLLIGSVPLGSAEEVFETLSSSLGDRVCWAPDGETGERINWIQFQIPILAQNPLLELVQPDPDKYTTTLPFLRLKEGADPAALSFSNLGYRDAALASYAVFQDLKRDGRIPRHWRFQVSLPTPLAAVGAFVLPQDQPKVEPAYTRQLLAELDEICASIPQDELAIQWDVAVEFALLEGVFPSTLGNVEEEIIERLTDIGNRVPEGVHLGYHLCYGDYEHHHFAQPKDASTLVRVANAVSRRVERPIQFVHLPVPRDRTDDAYYAPLRELELQPETRLFLGLVHHTDGLEGTLKRVEAAGRVIGDFGVATECGLGRRPSETIPELLRIHAEAAAQLGRAAEAGRSD
jgi:hypothetical protein